MTLKAWGPETDRPPLKAAICDNSSNSPFSLAFLHGHHDVAKAILEIVQAQWSPVEEDRVRYKIEDEDDDSDYDSEEHDSDVSADQPRIVSEKVDRNFTIEDIGKVSMQVKSHTKPLEILCNAAPSFVVEKGDIAKEFWTRSMFIHVLDTDNSSALNILLDMVRHFAGQKISGDNADGDDNFNFPESHFRWAVEHGKTRLLGQIIKRTGAGIPLDHLVKKSGIEVKQKPRFYQGLTVYGKKRYGYSIMKLTQRGTK